MGDSDRPGNFAHNQHYYMALVDRVHDTGQIINSLGDQTVELRGQIEELKAGVVLEAVAVAE